MSFLRVTIIIKSPMTDSLHRSTYGSAGLMRLLVLQRRYDDGVHQRGDSRRDECVAARDQNKPEWAREHRH